jgi:hypothetical protein
VAEPDPLSLMPGPSGTESRWAPAITVWLSRPVGVSAMRFCVGTLVRTKVDVARCTTTSPCRKRLYSSSPIANDVPTTGMSMSAASPRVGLSVSCRSGAPGVPSL